MYTRIISIIIKKYFLITCKLFNEYKIISSLNLFYLYFKETTIVSNINLLQIGGIIINKNTRKSNNNKKNKKNKKFSISVNIKVNLTLILLFIVSIILYYFFNINFFNHI